MPDRPSAVVLVCQPLLYNTHGAYRTILESAGFEVRFPRVGGSVLTALQLAAELPGVHATIASTEPYSDAILQDAPDLRVISRTGVGYDSIDVKSASERGIVVALTPGTNHEAVAEHAFALLLATEKRVIANHAAVAQCQFNRRASRALRGRTLGLVGLGRIGRAVAFRAAAFGLSVIACDPFLSTVPDDVRGVELTDFAGLLARSDIISLHAASTGDTKRLICRATLAQMKHGVVLINTARGTLIDEVDLREALDSGKVAAAGLDVFDREPPIDSPLLSAPNVVLSPHVAGIDEQAFDDMATMAAQTIVDLSQGLWPVERLVNADQLRPGSSVRE